MSGGKAILEAQGLSKRFAGFTAVDSVNLRVREGSIHALIGPNGAGKTTCFNLLTKFLQPSAGRITFRGEDISGESPAAVARRGLVRSFQISAVFAELSVLENVRIALQRGAGLRYAFWRSGASLGRLDARALELLDDMGLAERRDDLAADLPYGSKRALEIAATLAADPVLLLLDEPTQGMGHEDVDRVVQLIRRVAKGRTVLMVEHNMRVVSNLADTITVLRSGSVLAEGDYAAVSSNPTVREAYMGHDGASALSGVNK